jgi:hypothetical protein
MHQGTKSRVWGHRPCSSPMRTACWRRPRWKARRQRCGGHGSGPNRQDAGRPPEEAGEGSGGEGSGGRPTKSARRCRLCRSPTGFVEAVAFQQVHRGTASAATRWRSEMAGPDSIFAKELNGDNPFLIAGVNAASIRAGHGERGQVQGGTQRQGEDERWHIAHFEGSRGPPRPVVGVEPTCCVDAQHDATDPQPPCSLGGRAICSRLQLPVRSTSEPTKVCRSNPPNDRTRTCLGLSTT